ncbi:sensor histidine kinase [Nonomuraea ferruginea]
MDENAAFVVGRPVEEINDTLRRVTVLLAGVAALGVLVAASVGLLVSRAALRPVGRLTRAVEHIAQTEDLDTRIPVEGGDEIARLSASFNAMTAALASSRDRQRQLVADAGHELRTPLTTLRTNIDLLLRSEQTGRSLDPGAKERLLVNVKAQFAELTTLVGDLLQLARGDTDHEPHAELAFQQVVTAAVERARLRGAEIAADLEPWYVVGGAASLERAVLNLLDNAAKFSPDSEVEVTLRDGELTVRDHGPGIPEEELPHVFDRFWRSPSARSLPGSGLGLAIVHQAVKEVGGEIRLHNAADGGVVATMTLPGTPAPRRAGVSSGGQRGQEEGEAGSGGLHVVGGAETVTPRGDETSILGTGDALGERGREAVAHRDVGGVAGQRDMLNRQVSVTTRMPSELLEAERGIQHHASPPQRLGQRIARS